MASGSSRDHPPPCCRPPPCFAFPNTHDPVEHVALTYPGGPIAFASHAEALASSSFVKRRWAIMLLRKLLPGVPLQKQLAADGAWLLPSSKSLSGLIIGVVQEGAHVEAPPEDLVEVWRQRSPQCGEQATRGAGIVAEDTPRGAPLLRLPRALLLSTADAPAFIRDNCLLESSRPRQKQQKQLTPCSSEELLAVLLVKELLLLRHLRMQEPTAAAAAASGCLLHTNKRNAPYFGPFLWKALSLVLPHQAEQQQHLQQQLLHLVRGSLAAELSDATQDDIKMAVSLVHARSVWDGEGHVAVSALDELQAYHWNSDWAIQHETSAEGLVWRAPRDIRRGENLFVNYGQYSNAHLLFHFGVELSGNPWGPAFFWRTDIGEIPYAALPNAVTSVSILRSAVSSSSALPLWLQGSAWAPKEGPCHPPLEGPSCAAPKLDFEEPRADRVFSAQAMSPDGQIGIICDQRVFTLRAFGRGAFVLSLFGAVGGVDATVYKCVRVLRFGEVTDALEREVLTSRLFHDACKQHHVQLSQADHVLKGGIAATENQLLLLQRTGPPAALEEASEELHRLKAMQRAARGNKLFTDKCIRYFSKIVSALHQKKRGARRRNTHRT
ncbi:uncharacterized protein LOC34623281 [Cyclospora cayetanensis]|uniref:Uncharacterized protein LOC34623281 n=1 Tax=Cyclospora cayetanensis TaxID=88456 RepID=A0A6P6S0R1_9EIME|nr:uncharacterized protein LOC34623281 [Cyclospora cayetanensis]